MALTRKFLSALGIDADKIDEIINAHTESIDGLKDELAKAKTEAGKLPTDQKELDDLKAAAEKDGKDPWKVKYEAIKEDYDNYKKEVAAKETKAAKAEAYKALLKECGVSHRDAVVRVTDLDAIKLDKDGKIEDAAKLKASIKTEWADLIKFETIKGAETATPPQNNGGAPKTREEIYKRDDNGHFVYDSAQRQAALSQLIAAEQQKG